jgi:thiol peroxidase
MSNTVTLQGNPVSVSGHFPVAGEQAKPFSLVAGDLSDATLATFAGKRKILNIFPSVDTPTCATSVRKFNQLAANQPNTVVLAISKDLPFAQGRFCTTEGITNVIPLSDYRYTSDFAEKYGVLMTDGPLAGLLARSVVVIDPEGKVVYTELVPEITQEPNYEAALKAVK